MSATTYVLGVNAGTAAWHDPAAALITNEGEVLALVEEERPTRVRHAARCMWPRHAVEQCLHLAGLDRGDIAAVVVGWDEPRLREQNGQPWDFEAPAAFLAELGFTEPGPDLYCVSHHRAHAASALYASPFDAAAVLVADGNGEDEATTLYAARRGQPLIRLVRWPQTHSLGHLYEAASVWLGLGKRGEGKTMGLAAYAEHTPSEPGWLVPGGQELVSARGRDTRLGYDDLKHAWRADMASYAGVSAPTAASAELHRDPTAVRVAAAAQSTVEHVMGWWAQQARRLSGLQPLCLAGGVALNCAANATLPPPVFVPPVPHDAGVALGAAWLLCPPQHTRALSPYLGRTPGPVAARHEGWTSAELDVDRVARLLLDGQIVGVCRGRAEAGPRALCHRSLLASPTRAGMAERLNALKRREPWRPFGPVTHREHREWWSSVGELDRYMLGAATLTPRGAAELPAVRHADGTTRPQQLTSAEEPFVAAVLDALETAGHPPVLVNTSFNGPAEPLVDTALDALDCADRIGLDVVLTDHALLQRRETS